MSVNVNNKALAPHGDTLLMSTVLRLFIFSKKRTAFDSARTSYPSEEGAYRLLRLLRLLQGLQGLHAFSFSPLIFCTWTQTRHRQRRVLISFLAPRRHSEVSSVIVSTFDTILLSGIFKVYFFFVINLRTGIFGSSIGSFANLEYNVKIKNMY